MTDKLTTAKEKDRKTAHDIVHNWAAEQGYTGLSADLVNLINDVSEALTKARVEGRLGYDSNFAE